MFIIPLAGGLASLTAPWHHVLLPAVLFQSQTLYHSLFHLRRSFTCAADYSHLPLHLSPRLPVVPAVAAVVAAFVSEYVAAACSSVPIAAMMNFSACRATSQIQTLQSPNIVVVHDVDVGDDVAVAVAFMQRLQHHILYLKSHSVAINATAVVAVAAAVVVVVFLFLSLLLTMLLSLLLLLILMEMWLALLTLTNMQLWKSSSNLVPQNNRYIWKTGNVPL